MNEGEASAYIASKIYVTPQKVSIAGTGLLQLAGMSNDALDLINKFLESMDARMPGHKIMLQPGPQPTEELDRIANALTWAVAASEALWDLLYAGMLLPHRMELANLDLHVSWSFSYSGSEGGGGRGGSWSFDEYAVKVPTLVVRRLSHSRDSQDRAFLSNPDLYLNNLAIPDMHPEIIQVLREGVACFRRGLHTATVAMLGKASEGAWLEVGAALLEYGASNNAKSFQKIREDLENPFVSISKKIALIVQLYEKQDTFGQLAAQSGVSLDELRQVANWSDTVRDSRNTIHFGVKSAVPNTYEKVAALLLGAVPNFQVLYRLRAAAGIPSKDEKTAESLPSTP